VITDADILAGQHVTFSADTVYILDGMVFVDSLATLTIEAGTLIKAEDGQDTDASGLVITRDAKIYAEGTADQPIIFTSVLDDMQGNLDYSDRGLWGGVVILGRATTNNSGDKAVEGVNNIDPERSLYGGDQANHSSGVFRYVSIRHTGINVGSEAGNEIQGLTLGAVGAGTIIEYVESFASADDGYEFFGGTVNTRYLVSAFCSDDAFDWDQGFNGKHQFWFAIQAPDEAGRVAEMDGAGGNEQGTPYALPMLSNVTYIGAGVGSTPTGDGKEMLIFRDNTGGFYYNSIFTDYDDASSSRGISQFASQDFVQTHLAANNNMISDPKLRGIGREQGGNGLDPRLSSQSPALNTGMDVQDDYFVQTSYLGAFGGSNWMNSWTALDQLGYIGNLTTVDDQKINSLVPVEFVLEQNYPNPFNPTTTINYSVAKAGLVRISVYNALGQRVAVLLDNHKTPGSYKMTWDASSLSSGVYFYKLQTGTIELSRKMLLVK